MFTADRTSVVIKRNSITTSKSSDYTLSLIKECLFWICMRFCNCYLKREHETFILIQLFFLRIVKSDNYLINFTVIKLQWTIKLSDCSFSWMLGNFQQTWLYSLMWRCLQFLHSQAHSASFIDWLQGLISRRAFLKNVLSGSGILACSRSSVNCKFAVFITSMM